MGVGGCVLLEGYRIEVCLIDQEKAHSSNMTQIIL
jgi:hypothetical protein